MQSTYRCVDYVHLCNLHKILICLCVCVCVCVCGEEILLRSLRVALF